MYKVAVVHDWLVDLGGAEKVLHEIIKCFPNADIFSTVEYLDESSKWIVHNKNVKTSFIQKLPRSKQYRKYLPLMFLAIENLDLSDYDLVISSSSSVAKSIITGPGQVHICYCHSPMRYAWDMQNKYLRDSGVDKGIKSWILRYLLHRVRVLDYRSAASVDYFIANSHYISQRIMKCYRRDSEVIYPNVDISDFALKVEKDDYYLACSRLVPYKKIDLIVSSFKKLPDKKLVVIGDGPDFLKIKKLAGDNVKILGFQKFDVLKEYMSNAKAFIYAAEEDFGIVPVEAQACGTPVIAFAKGGLRETVIDEETGVFFNEQNVESLVNAIKRFEIIESKFDKYNIRKNSERFSAEKFRVKFKEFCDSKMDL